FGWMTGDNVGVNDRAARCVQRAEGINTKDRPWKAHERRGRCMEHTIHLGAKAFIEALNPTIGKKKTQATVEDDDSSGDDDDFDWDQLEAVPNNNEIDEPINFDPGDVLGKVLALITQIRSSPQAKAYFHTLCKEEGLKPLELIKWIRTRWGSMSDLVNRVILNRA
ncbi:hypothetical protein DXG01_015214, partial [Tephrocybe rancida]